MNKSTVVIKKARQKLDNLSFEICIILISIYSGLRLTFKMSWRPPRRRSSIILFLQFEHLAIYIFRSAPEQFKFLPRALFAIFSTDEIVRIRVSSSCHKGFFLFSSLASSFISLEFYPFAGLSYA